MDAIQKKKKSRGDKSGKLVAMHNGKEFHLAEIWDANKTTLTHKSICK